MESVLNYSVRTSFHFLHLFTNIFFVPFISIFLFYRTFLHQIPQILFFPPSKCYSISLPPQYLTILHTSYKLQIALEKRIRQLNTVGNFFVSLTLKTISVFSNPFF